MPFHRSLQTRGLFACHCQVEDEQITVGILLADPDEVLDDFPVLVDREMAGVKYQVSLVDVAFETVNYNFALRRIL
jgi:hypothetical protein